MENNNIKTKITVRKGGSLLIEGDFILQDKQGNEIKSPKKHRIAICRCGASLKQPFCDGSHKNINFEKEVTTEQPITS